MKKQGIFKSFLIIVIILGIIGVLSPTLFRNLKFGLDLKGGFEVLYEVQGLNGEAVSSDMVTNTYKTMLKRIDVLGVSEPVITIEGDNKIRVQLAGITDAEEARKILSQAANLTFRDTKDQLLMSSDVLHSGGAKVGQDNKGRPAVSLSVKDKDQFYRVTKNVSEMSDNRIVIWLDFDETSGFAKEEAKCGSLGNSKCLSVATVGEGFASDVIIQGNFTQKEVKNLVDLINSGSLPTKLEEISSKTVTASFGMNSLDKTVKAGIVGISLIILLMIVIYHFAGVIASLGMIIYTFLTFAIFWLIGGVLTLPGIAAMLLGIGMAVDANVINFSRIKDELKKGKNFQAAYKAGNKNSLVTIIDSNLTTLLVAVILFIFGESSIKGFATMLMISILVTMFVMVFIARYLLNLFVKTGYFDKRENLFLGIQNKNLKKEEWRKFNFIKSSRVFFAISILLVVLGCVSLGWKGLKLGIDFKGGSSITLHSEKGLQKETIEQDLKKMGYTLSTIEIRDQQTIDLLIEESLSKEQVLETEKHFQEQYQAESDIGVVSNVVKKELIKNAFLSLLLASIGIVIYISMRYKFSYAIGAIVSLLHDAFLIVAVFSILNLEVSSIFVAAILSIIGYSINDTIVLFDRIKENIKEKEKNTIKKKEQLEEIVNMSLRQTFTRSLITTLTTLVPVVCLIFMGAHEIINFNIAMLIGLIAGSYSSICIASQLWYQIEKRTIGKPKKKKWYDEPEELKIKGVNS